MPLLPLEPYLFPGNLFSAPEWDGSNDSRWWVLHTRPRAEKSLARRFVDRHLSFFLPLHKRQWCNQGRRFCSHVPLFPGYVFLYGDSHARWEALRTNLVANVLPVADQEQLHVDLTRVYQLIVSSVPLQPEEHLAVGTPVEITDGPLAGLAGKVIRQDKQFRFVVEVQFLQRGVSVAVERWMFEPICHAGRALVGPVA
jgi:transcription antitermination factor NusG